MAAEGKVFSPFVKQFSAIEGLQEPYTLVYSLDSAESEQCKVSLCRTGRRESSESVQLQAEPEQSYRVLRFLYENAVQPEIWRDVISDLLGGKGGTACE